MKKALILTVLFFAGSIFAQAEKITGDWLLTSVVMNGESKDVYSTFSFAEDGNMVTMGIPFGTWKYDSKANAIIAASKFGKGFSGKMKITKLSDSELVLKKDNVVYNFRKLDKNKIAENNGNSKLSGVWQYDNEGLHTYLKFDLPDTFASVTTGDGSVETINGSWLFLPENNDLVISAISTPFRGKNKVKEISADKIVIETKDGEVTAVKAPNSAKIDSLNFTEDDLPEDGDVSKLPWNDFNEMAQKLATVRFLKYRHGKLLPKVNDFEYSEILKKIKVNLEKPRVEFTNFTIIGKDTSQYSQKIKGNLQNSYNIFFPLDEFYRFRILRNEKVKVPAGEFQSTVVEAADGDDKYKLWLINDLPGVYAKIIKVSESPFGKSEYTVEELEEISK